MIRPPTQHEIDHDLKKARAGWSNFERESEEGFYFSDAQVEGEIPLELKGTFIRNGPGLNTVYGTPLVHPIDGDGLVATVTFLEGKAHFRCKFVQTKTHVAEKQAGKMLFDGQMGTFAPKADKKPGFRDPSHTNVFYHGGKLFTAHEYTLPHTLDPMSLETVKQETLNNELELRTMSAHFRYDVDLDSFVTVSFKPGNPKRPSRISFYEWDRAMGLKQAARLQLEHVHYAHDFILTPSYYVVHVTPFIDTSLETITKIAKGELLPGQTMRYQPGAASQMVLIERFPKDPEQRKVHRFDTEPCHIYHFAHCREDPKTGRVTFQACCLPTNFNMDWQHKGFLSNTADAPGVMHSYEIDVKQGSISRRPTPGLEATACEFPTTHPFRNCVRNDAISTRYFYLMAGAPGVSMPFTDVVKYDLQTQMVTRFHFSKAVVGEPVFLPRLGRASAWHGAEDDGWVIVQVFLYEESKVQFCVFNAQTIHQGPVCRLNLPFHLPYGFHGTYTEEVFVRPSVSKL